jgi:hypothetical protein
MFTRIKTRVLDAVSKKLKIPDLLSEIHHEMGYRQADFRDLTLELDTLKGKLNSLHKSMLPVVLFTGTLKHGEIHLVDFAFAVRAEPNSAGAEPGFHINFQPDCNILVRKIAILNGVCDIVECRMCNVDMLPTFKASFPYDAGEITIDAGTGFPVTPANRIYMKLAPRPLV